MRAIEATVAGSPESVEPNLRAALAEQGFGVLTEIDVAAVLHAKLGVERPPLKILGACNPTLAHQALERDPSAALMLPCNVVLAPGPGGTTKVSAVDPRDLIGDPTLIELADDAASRLSAALASISSVEGS